MCLLIYNYPYFDKSNVEVVVMEISLDRCGTHGLIFDPLIN
jgi:hypothetical protein